MEEQNEKAVVKKNSIGTAGFVLALLGLIFCWVPVLDWILGTLGLIFSFIGVFRSPKGLSIAGLIMSGVGIIIAIIIAIFAAAAITTAAFSGSFL